MGKSIESRALEIDRATAKLDAYAEKAAGVWPELLPLVPPQDKAQAFPVQELGLIGGAAADVASQVECPLEIAINTALAGASLAVSGLAMVTLPHGEIKPCNLFVCTLAGSNDRKSATETRLLKFAEDYQRQEDMRLEEAIEKAKEEAREAAKSKREKKEAEMIRGEYVNILLNSPTVESIAHGFKNTPIAGLFSAEGGAFLNGYSMGASAAASLAFLNHLFDGKTPRDTRIMRDTPPLYDRVFAIGLMVQPGIAAAALMDNKLAEQNGFLSRCLLAQPQSIRGGRFSRESWYMTDDLRQYQETAKNHLSTAFAQAGGSLECERDVLVFNPAAKSVWYDYRDECERMGAAGGEYDHVFTPILRSPEMAGRIAAILHKFDGYEGNEIDEATTRRAVAVACWYRDEAVRIAGNHAPDEKYQRAQKLAEWIYSRPGDRVSVQDVYQKGTVTAFSGKRNAREAKYLLSFLAEHGYVMPDTKTEYLKRPGGISDASATPNPAKIANSANSFYIQ